MGENPVRSVRLHLTSLSALFFLLVCFCIFALSCSSSNPPALRTVDGPEDDTVLQNTNGFILTEEDIIDEVRHVLLGRQIIAVSLPDMKKQVILDRKGKKGIFAIAGPDRSGRIVYVENHKIEKKHLLKTTNLTGSTDLVIFERSGDAIWDDVIGRDIALSPSGEKVAFVGKHQTLNIDSHKRLGFLIDYGPLEVWLVEAKTPLKTNVHAVDRGMSWFPDNNQLAYTTLLPRSRILQEQPNQEISEKFGNWDKIPAVMILDLSEGTNHFLRVGWGPVVSLDGRSVLVSDVKKQYWLVDVKTRQSQLIEWPGDWGGPISFVGENLVLYFGLPTKGTKPQWTERNSSLVGPKSMGTLKVADFKTGKFKTVLSPVDPRMQVGFGKVAR